MGRKRIYFTEEEKLEAKRKTKREYNRRNRETVNSNSKKWYSENKERKHNYYKENKKPLTENGDIKKCVRTISEKNREKAKKWRLKNPEKVREINSSSRKNRKKNDPLFRLTCNVRSMLCKVIQRQGYTKRTRCYEILGCEFDKFKTHIEFQWEDWMNWDNYGKYNGTEKFGWDIDHIIPVSSANTEEEVLKLNHYKNLQPLCSKINRDIKINKIDF